MLFSLEPCAFGTISWIAKGKYHFGNEHKYVRVRQEPPHNQAETRTNITH